MFETHMGKQDTVLEESFQERHFKSFEWNSFYQKKIYFRIVENYRVVQFFQTFIL